jgi:predicted MFS family arabinose efflux permease
LLFASFCRFLSGCGSLSAQSGIIAVCAYGFASPRLVPCGARAAAPKLASTLNIGAFNVGNAMGAWMGGGLCAGRESNP